MSDIIKRLEEIGCQVSPCGSRVTCDPPPTNTDEDHLVLCPNASIVGDAVDLLWSSGLKWEGSEHYQEVAADGFMSWRSATNVNLIVTSNKEFHRRHLAATALCRRLNLLDKRDRIALFQAVLYGNIHQEETKP